MVLVVLYDRTSRIVAVPFRGRQNPLMRRSLMSLLLLAAAADPLGSLPGAAGGRVRIFLVRHGQAFSNLDPEPDLPAEQLDHLTALGRKQAARAAHALRGRGVTLVLSSPASRARETAAIVATTLGLAEAAVDAHLRPLDLGRSSEGKPLDWDARAAEWEKGRDPEPAGGESMEQMAARVAELVSRLSRERRDQAVVLVAHGEVIGAYVGLLQGRPPARRYPPNLGNASITVVEAGAGAPPRLLLVNHSASL
jgi:broad specificity phosphatase PhoE